MFRTPSVAICMTMLALGMEAAHATPVNWSGQNWEVNNGSVAVQSPHLEVTTSYETYQGSGIFVGSTYYDTDSGFQASPTPYVKATFEDTGSGAGPYLAMESGTNATWAEIGANSLNDVPAGHYSLVWNGDLIAVDLGPRVAGDHTVQIGMRADGTLDFWLDQSLVHSTNAAQPGTFEWVYLGGAGTSTNDKAIFKSFETGINYVVPEPSTLGLVCVGAVGLLMRRRWRSV